MTGLWRSVRFHRSTSACCAFVWALLAADIAPGQIVIEIPTTLVGWPILSDNTQFPDVAVSTAGTIVFIWSENGYQRPRVAVTHAYSEDGIALSAPVQVSTSGKVSFTGIASDLRGGFIASWDWNENSGNDYVIGRRLDSLGRGVGTQLVINADRPTPYALLARPAGLMSGAVIMWEQPYDLWMRLYDENGNSRGPSTGFSPGSRLAHVTNDVVALSDGGFVIAWADDVLGGSWARIFDENGAPLGPRFQMSDAFEVHRITAFPGGWAAIGATSNDEWTSPPPPVFTPNRLIIQRYDNAGAHLGTIEAHDAGYRKWLQADLAVDTSGNLVATWIWLDWDSSANSPPIARAFDSSGAPYGDPVTLSDQAGYDVHPKALPNGGIVAVWEGHGNAALQPIYATWIRVCGDGEVCEAPPTRTPTETVPPAPTSTPTSTPVPLPGCGDGVVNAYEECDDGNRTNGDGCDSWCLIEQCGNGRREGDEECDPPDATGRCRADCTQAAIHDSVMVPEKAIDVVIPAGQDSVTKIVPMQVRNADIEPSPERPGHVIRLIASDGDCPAGTVQGLPDFERGVDGDQDSILVAGGTPKTAHVTIFASRATFPNLDTKIPSRCTLVLTAETLVEGNVDPTPDNNTITVELNVRVARGDPLALAESDQQLEPGVFVASVKPLKIKISAGVVSRTKSIKVRVANGMPSGSADRRVALGVEDGSCPPGTVVVGEFAGVAGGGQIETVAARRAVSGKVHVTATDALFDSASMLSPGRCTATVVIGDPDRADERAYQRTALTVEATDLNDFSR